MVGAASLRKISVRGKIHRIISSKYPPIGLYDTQAAPSDLEATLEVAALTDSRIRRELNVLRGLSTEEWVTGLGSTMLMSAICNPNADGTRFADDSYGVYYAAGSIRTALLETAFHRERFLRTALSAVAPHTHMMRRYECALSKPLHRITRRSHEELLSPNVADYPRSQSFAKLLRDRGSFGLHYPSVRDPKGWCVAVFRPSAIKLPVQGASHYAYQWDGERLAVVSEVGESFYVSKE